MDVLNENEVLETEDGEAVIMLDGEPFEIIADLEHGGEIYFALTPAQDDDVSEDEELETEFVILKGAEENGESFLVTVDDENLYDKIGQMFLAIFAEEG